MAEGGLAFGGCRQWLDQLGFGGWAMPWQALVGYRQLFDRLGYGGWAVA